LTTIAFSPNNAQAPPFQVSVTLDGVSYLMVTRWSTYRQDWMVSLSDQSGNVVINQALIGSPPNADIPLFPGLFQTSTVVFRVSTQQFEIGP
jgi:hypothetical protein